MSHRQASQSRVAPSPGREEDLCHAVPYYKEPTHFRERQMPPFERRHSTSQGFLRDFLRRKDVADRIGEFPQSMHTIPNAEFRRHVTDPGRYEMFNENIKPRSKLGHITKEADIWIGDQIGIREHIPAPEQRAGSVPFFSRRRAALEKAQVLTYDPYVTEYMANFVIRGGDTRERHSGSTAEDKLLKKNKKPEERAQTTPGTKTHRDDADRQYQENRSKKRDRNKQGDGEKKNRGSSPPPAAHTSSGHRCGSQQDNAHQQTMQTSSGSRTKTNHKQMATRARDSASSLEEEQEYYDG